MFGKFSYDTALGIPRLTLIVVVVTLQYLQHYFNALRWILVKLTDNDSGEVGRTIYLFVYAGAIE